MTKPFPARIHILLAQKAPLGLVIRRGPSKRVATLLWDRRTDQFQLGQWLKGRIYPRSSDLSPDGNYFIYFAMNGKWDSEAMGSWTAISRAPYLKALFMIPWGHFNGGGGLWTSETSYWQNGTGFRIPVRGSRLVQRDETYKPQEGLPLRVYYPRLLRDGWELKHLAPRTKRYPKTDIFDKLLSNGWVLRKLAHTSLKHPQGKGVYWDTHQLIHSDSNTILDNPEWEWAEYDRHRLVWSTGGKLFAGKVTNQGLVNETELYDFNPMSFEPIIAPY